MVRQWHGSSQYALCAFYFRNIIECQCHSAIDTYCNYRTFQNSILGQICRVVINATNKESTIERSSNGASLVEFVQKYQESCERKVNIKPEYNVGTVFYIHNCHQKNILTRGFLLNRDQNCSINY